MGLLKQILIFLVTLYAAMWFLNSESKYSPEYLKGKKIVITGASSGVGEQLAYHYAQMGAQLILAARRQTLLNQVAQKCRQLGAKKVDLLMGDLTIEETQNNLTKLARKTFGGEINQLLLCHGTYGANRWSGSEADLNRLKNTMSTNFVSFVDLTSKLFAQLNKAKGNIGVISGLAGLVPMPLLSDLSASQAAQQRFFSSLRQELMENSNNNNNTVTVTTIILGLIKTDKSTPIYEKWFSWLNLLASTSAEGAAQAIAKGVTDGVDQVFYPFQARIQRYFFDIYQEVYEYSFHFI
ncbi:hypothetical protein CHUAL_003959 [Chamberlinius hualienensis]